MMLVSATFFLLLLDLFDLGSFATVPGYKGVVASSLVCCWASHVWWNSFWLLQSEIGKDNGFWVMQNCNGIFLLLQPFVVFLALGGNPVR